MRVQPHGVSHMPMQGPLAWDHQVAVACPPPLLATLPVEGALGVGTLRAAIRVRSPRCHLAMVGLRRPTGTAPARACTRAVAVGGTLATGTGGSAAAGPAQGAHAAAATALLRPHMLLLPQPQARVACAAGAAALMAPEERRTGTELLWRVRAACGAAAAVAVAA